MTMVQILQEIISLITGGLVGYMEGFAKGVQAMITNLMFTLSEQGAIIGLSAFGSVVVIFAALSLAIGLSYKGYQMITSLGSRK